MGDDFEQRLGIDVLVARQQGIGLLPAARRHVLDGQVLPRGGPEAPDLMEPALAPMLELGQSLGLPKPSVGQLLADRPCRIVRAGEQERAPDLAALFDNPIQCFPDFRTDGRPPLLPFLIEVRPPHDRAMRTR